MGARIYVSIDLLGPWCVARHRSNKRYSAPRAWYQIPNSYTEPARFGRQYSQSRAQLVTRNECAGTAFAMPILVQWSFVREINCSRNNANAIQRVSDSKTNWVSSSLVPNAYGKWLVKRNICVFYRKRNTEFTHRLCAPKREYADIANRGSSVFYDNCKSWLILLLLLSNMASDDDDEKIAAKLATNSI